MVRLALIALASGASALMFEALWFHQAGLVVGNSVWASSLVTASFMAGLALGSGLTAAHGHRVRHALRAYALLEATIGVVGLAVVFVLPSLTYLLVPVFRGLLDHPALLNLVRAAVTFAVMAVPATAMGATLPLLVKSAGWEFGRSLGWVYGMNTLGGVAGVLLGEMVLVVRLGVPGTALVAAGLNAAAALGAWRWSRRLPAEDPPLPPVRWTRAPRTLLAAAALSGALLLALEVVWFRFLQLFVYGTSLAFALMLAVVLIGIAAGGLLAAAWLEARANAEVWLPALALLAGGTTLVGYAAFDPVPWPGRVGWTAFWMAVQLTLPGATLSGLVFTLLGTAVRRGAHGDAEAAGRLALVNTAGAMAGALLGGFLLLPRMGVEKSLFLLGAGYLVLAILAAAALWRPSPVAVRYATAAVALLFVGAAALFPFGLMRNRHIRRIAEGSRVVAFREGLTETLTYLRTDWLDEPLSYTLVTNAHSMSGTDFYAQRYMKLYVYWALAMNPDARSALLVCYGVGNTAQALTDSRQLETIDVVDVSRDVLALGGVPHPPPSRNPLQDPRVRVHVEDGRFFLLNTTRRFDLITAEPPPPKGAGVANLYTREYFQLVRDRLADGGVVTYWLPVDQLLVDESRSVVRAFCAAFAECSLWTGGGGEWMLAARRGPARPVEEDAFERQWHDPQVGPEMRRLGLEVPETLGALFVADAAQLAEWAGDAPPLEDAWPRRLSPQLRQRDPGTRASLPGGDAARARFAQSAWVRRSWPPELRERTLPFFQYRGALDDAATGAPAADREGMLRRVLAESKLPTLALVLMYSEPAKVEIARRALAAGKRGPAVEYHVGAGALAEGRYEDAATHFEAVLAADPGPGPAALMRDVARELARTRGTDAPRSH
jgi:predicted membrane-bound spermidine synthase